MTPPPKAPALMADHRVAAVIVTTHVEQLSLRSARTVRKQQHDQARRIGLLGAAVRLGRTSLVGVEGAGADIARFVEPLIEDRSTLAPVILVQRTVERPLFAQRGLVGPRLRPGETAWLDAAMRREPPDGESLLAFLSWTALRQTEADLGFYSAEAVQAEAWSPFERAATDQPDPTPETDFLSPTYS